MPANQLNLLERLYDMKSLLLTTALAAMFGSAALAQTGTITTTVDTCLAGDTTCTSVSGTTTGSTATTDDKDHQDGVDDNTDNNNDKADDSSSDSHDDKSDDSSDDSGSEDSGSDGGSDGGSNDD